MVTADFTYETQFGTIMFKGHVEALDFDDIMEAVTKIADYCNVLGYKLRRCDINDIKEDKE